MKDVKHCSSCKEEFPRTSKYFYVRFTKGSISTFSSACKQCVIANAKARYLARGNAVRDSKPKRIGDSKNLSIKDRNLIDNLTEELLLNYFSQGRSEAYIVLALGIAHVTYRNYVQKLLTKWDACNLLELMYKYGCYIKKLGEGD